MERRITCITTSTLIEAISRACVEGRKITVANDNVHGYRQLKLAMMWLSTPLF
jgi:N-acetylglucosaminyldiphosphoundecaprenol N-acetyl-beta-D-mannosaminyltransferase